ncbi:uncharacterized protein LOC119718925 [Patiria miniata]|uniref:Ig-like domain-containing protein n=1 Tax=Patiria miniata TaxID=46514 RepID=A0A913YY42_PATMI|nr:uncharacterized protein LOC119718925 [Patiria miniata]
MDRMISMYFCLLSWWCILHANRILMVISAEPTVTAWIITPEADRKEGGRVEMRCVATNLEADHVVEWMTEDPTLTLRWGNVTLARTGRRFVFETMQTMIGQTTQMFTITDLERGDTDEYICNVHGPIAGGGYFIVATAKVNLTVLYFPNESFPICSPDGPITVDTGTQLNMRCSSEYGNSAVLMQVSQSPTGFNTHMWMITFNNDTLFASLDLTVGIGDHNAMFQCIITSTYFPGMNRSCTIGPIQVTGSPAELTTETLETEHQATVKPSFTSTSLTTETITQTLTNPTSSTIHSSAIAAAVAAGGVLLVAMAAIIVCLCNRQQGCCNKGPTTRTETQVSNVDPYVELQKSTDEGNREYMELGAKEATTSNTTRDGEANGGYVEPATVHDTPTESHAEYQAVEDDNESQEHDYDKPDPKHTEYEVVQAT